MDPLHNGVCLWVPDCYGLTFYAIVMQDHLSEFMSKEFITSIKGDLGWPRIPREPFLFYYIGYGDSSFVSILVYFKPARSRVNHCDPLANQVWLTFSPNLIWSN